MDSSNDNKDEATLAHEEEMRLREAIDGFQHAWYAALLEDEGDGD